MADSGSGVKQFTGEMQQATGEIVKDVKDEMGKLIEQGVQSIAGTTLSPQQLQQQELDRQKKLNEARRKIDYWKKIAEEQKRVREQEKQKQMQIDYKKQEEEKEKKFEIFQKKKEIPIAIKALGKAELKRGVGG